jgi:hypothetical protein
MLRHSSAGKRRNSYHDSDMSMNHQISPSNTMRKPWNLPSYPVYSLLTESTLEKNPQLEILRESQKNMNVMTYVIPVSMSPKHYVIALYHDTQSLENWESSHKGILQILAPSHSSLVRVLGKKSGKTYDKMRYFSKK